MTSPHCKYSFFVVCPAAAFFVLLETQFRYKEMGSSNIKLIKFLELLLGYKVP